ncbi:MAG: hypothetical protein AAGK04_02180 [Planctomycetota bacterium]
MRAPSRSPLAQQDVGEVPILACASAIDMTPDAEHRVLLIADSTGERAASMLGLTATHRFSPPLGRARLAAGQLRARVRLAAEGASVVHVWNTELTQRVSGWLGHAARLMDGLSEDTPLRPLGRLADPKQLRRQLWLPPERPLLAMLSDPIRHFDAKALAFTAGIAEVCGVGPSVAMPSWTHDARRALRFHHAAQRWYPLRFPEAPVLAIAASADVVITRDRGAITSAERIAAAFLESNGVRVITPDHAETTDGVLQNVYSQLIPFLDAWNAGTSAA